MRLLALLILAGFLAACAGSDGGVDPPDPGKVTIVYSPDPGEIVLLIPDSVLLSVDVRPAQSFTAQFLVDGTLVHTGSQFMVRGDRVRAERYRVIVNVADVWYDDEWFVRVVTDIDRPVPPPAALVAAPGASPGSVGVQWDRPPDHLIDPEAPLEGFEIAVSLEPFSAADFDLQAITFVADNPGVIHQGADVGGLEEGTNYHMRVRAVDVLGRTSWPTAEVSAISTGSFELSGTVWQLDPYPAGWPAPVGSVLVEAGPQRLTTLEDGRFVLAGLPDVEPLVLRAQEGSGNYTLPIVTSPLEPVDRALDLVLVPRLNVAVRVDGVVSESTLREFLLQATLHELGRQPYDFFPWKQYPVKVWVWEYSVDPDTVSNQPGQEWVDYHAAFQTAIDRWNAGAIGDDRLLEYVPVSREFDPSADPGQEGVLVRLYESPPPWTNYGQVNYLRPGNGGVGEVVPELLEVQLRPTFLNQALADRIVAHELGHVLGLVHTRSETTLMHATSDDSQGQPTDEELFVSQFVRHGGRDMKANWIVQQ